MIAFEENLIGLLESVEDCLAKRRILPCLMLLYSGIDVIASLETGKASRSVFIRWVSFFACDTAADHTFLFADQPPNIISSYNFEPKLTAKPQRTEEDLT